MGSKQACQAPELHSIAQMQVDSSAEQPVPQAWVWMSEGSSHTVSDSRLTRLLARATTTCEKVAYMESVSQNEAVVSSIHNMFFFFGGGVTACCSKWFPIGQEWRSVEQRDGSAGCPML